MFCLNDINDGLGVRSILYSINYKIVIVRLYLYLRGRFCNLLEQKGGSVVDGAGAVCILMLIPLSLRGAADKESHTQVTSNEPIP